MKLSGTNLEGENMSELSGTLEREFLDKEYAHVYVNEFLSAYIATQIKVLREQRGMTQHELALAAEMKQARISLLENINYSSWSIKTLQRLADAFDVTLRVSFEEFSTCIGDIQKFGRPALERRPRLDDLRSVSKSKQDAAQLINDIVETASKSNVVNLADKKKDKGWQLGFPPSPKLASVFPFTQTEEDSKQEQSETAAAVSVGAPQ